MAELPSIAALIYYQAHRDPVLLAGHPKPTCNIE